MPHERRRLADGALLDEQGNVIPPGREAGRAGADDITWEAGKTMPQASPSDSRDEGEQFQRPPEP
jgi:hypothetical protein